MKRGLAEVVCIIDRSGSMHNIWDDTIGGFNSFLGDCRNAPEDRRMTVVLFDHDYHILHNYVPAKDTPDLTRETYVPRGNTALYDAIGRTINEVGARLAKTAECDRPESVIFAILTDGKENGSREFRVSQIKEMIEHQSSKYSWSFIYLGANQDSVLAAGNIGIGAGNVANYTCDSITVQSTFRKMSEGVSHRAKNAMYYSSTGAMDIMASVNNGSTEIKADPNLVVAPYQTIVSNTSVGASV